MAIETTHNPTPEGNDTLAWSKYLTNAGMKKSLAEHVVTAIIHSHEYSAASKVDLLEVKAELQKEIARSKTDMIKWIFGLFVAHVTLSVGLFLGLIKILS